MGDPADRSRRRGAFKAGAKSQPELFVPVALSGDQIHAMHPNDFPHLRAATRRLARLDEALTVIADALDDGSIRRIGARC